MNYPAWIDEKRVEDAEESRLQKLRALGASQATSSFSSSVGPTFQGPASARLNSRTAVGQKSPRDVEERRPQKSKGLKGPPSLTPISTPFVQAPQALFSRRWFLGPPGGLSVPSYPTERQIGLGNDLENTVATDIPLEVRNEILSAEPVRQRDMLFFSLSINPIDFQCAFRQATTLNQLLLVTSEWLLRHPDAGELTAPTVRWFARSAKRFELLLYYRPEVLQDYGSDALVEMMRGGSESSLSLLLVRELGISRKYDGNALNHVAYLGGKEKMELLLKYQPDALQEHGAKMLRDMANDIENFPNLRLPESERDEMKAWQTALVELMLYKQPEVLLDCGAETVKIAVMTSNKTIMLLLLDLLPEILRVHSTDVLEAVIRHRSDDGFRFLVECGVNVNIRDKGFSSFAFLWKAVCFHRLDTLELLLKCGADPFERDEEGKTVRDYAQDIGYVEYERPLILAERAWIDSKMTQFEEHPGSQDNSRVEMDLKVQDDRVSLYTLSSIDCDSLIDEGIDEVEDGQRSQCDEIEHGTRSEAIESSESPDTDYTGSTEDEVEGYCVKETVDIEIQHVLELLMTDFWKIYEKWAIETQDGESHSFHPQQSSSSSGKHHQPVPSHGHSSLTPSGRLAGNKRRILDEDSDDEDHEGDGRKAPTRQKVSRNDEIDTQFACPYYKQDPAAHCKIGSCTGPGFKSVTRVKEHLYRRHKSPPQCARCGEIFPDQDDLDRHARNDLQCEISEMIVVEGICPRKLRLLKCKKKNEDDPGEEGRWRNVFRILFPGFAPVPSPYHEVPSQAVEPQQLPVDFAQFSNTHLPGLVENRLVGVIHQRLNQIVEEELRNSLPGIIESAVSDLLQAWKTSSSSAPMMPGSVPPEIPSTPTNPPIETPPNLNQITSFPNDANSSMNLVSGPTNAYASQQNAPTPYGPSGSNSARVPVYQYANDGLPDLFPELPNLPMMMDTSTDVSDLWPSLTMQSDTSFPQTHGWGPNLGPMEPMGKGKNRAEHVLDIFSWD